MISHLKDEIINKSPSYITSKWVIERIPHIFNNDLEAYIDWKEKLSALIEVDSKSIVLTGSSAVGFSLNPYKNYKAFDAQSDIDVAIISGHYFDIAWHFLRNMGSKILGLTAKERLAVEEHKNRFIYWGTIATDRIVQLLPFGLDWIKAMDEMRKIAPTIDREINFRIYKDFEALRAYQNIGLLKLKDDLLKP